MSAKMNWDRVRKENQTKRSGSAWIGSDAVGSTPGKKIKPSGKRKSAKKSQPLGWSRMPGCICGKAIGFGGSHKKKCPRSNSRHSRADSSSSHNPFAQCIKKAGKLPPVRKFLSSLQTEVGLDHSIPVEDRQVAQKLIRALLESLGDTPAQKPESNDRKTLSSELALREIIERRLDVYLRASNGVALVAVDAVAKDLNLESYRFQCSPSTKNWELWGHLDKAGNYHRTLFSKAFTTGGIFCIEQLERAPDEIQFWIKSCLDGHTVAGSKDSKRHPDFVLLLTSSLGIRQLWSGNADASFVDRFSYLEKS
jgi:hypothetical protein